MERAAGIEPATKPWQGIVLPLAPRPHYFIYHSTKLSNKKG